MTSVTSSSNDGAIKTTDLSVPKFNGDSWRYVANLDFSGRIHSLGDLSRV